MKAIHVARVLCVWGGASLLTPTLVNATPACHSANGSLTELQVPAPNEPFGRFVGFATGTLGGAETWTFTAPLLPTPGGFDAGTHNVFVPRGGGMLDATGHAVLTRDPDELGTYSVESTLTIQGASSTGAFAGATGTITLTGAVFDFLGGPGHANFDLRYRGEICVP